MLTRLANRIVQTDSIEYVISFFCGLSERERRQEYLIATQEGGCVLRKILLSIKDLSISFGTRTLFQINKLEIFEGDRIGLVGLNGAGKSTFLRLINGDILPDNGTIKLNCAPCYFMQFSEQFPHVSNQEELSLFGVKTLQEQEFYQWWGKHPYSLS